MVLLMQPQGGYSACWSNSPQSDEFYDDHLPPYSQNHPGDMFRPEVMQTIEDKLDELDSELRELSLKIHGKLKSKYVDSHDAPSLTRDPADHPELMFQER